MVVGISRSGLVFAGFSKVLSRQLRATSQGREGTFVKHSSIVCVHKPANAGAVLRLVIKNQDLGKQYYSNLAGLINTAFKALAGKAHDKSAWLGTMHGFMGTLYSLAYSKESPPRR